MTLHMSETNTNFSINFLILLYLQTIKAVFKKGFLPSLIHPSLFSLGNKNFSLMPIRAFLKCQLYDKWSLCHNVVFTIPLENQKNPET